MSKNIVRKEKLVELYSERFKITKKEATEKIEASQEFIADILQKYDGIQLKGFLTIEKVHRAEREGRNPRTKEAITIKAKNRLKVKVGNELDEKINE